MTDCCARAISGHAAAPLRSDMNSRRLIASPEAKDSPSYRFDRASLRDHSMSALGHKQTYAAQKGMSALPPIETAKADSGKRSCLLYPRKRTCAVQSGMSALGHKRTFGQV